MNLKQKIESVFNDNLKNLKFFEAKILIRQLQYREMTMVPHLSITSFVKNLSKFHFCLFVFYSFCSIKQKKIAPSKFSSLYV